jgi:choline dehydrogenase
MAREVASQPALRDLLGEETNPGSTVVDRDALQQWVDAAVSHYYHPVGTCAMGTDDDPAAVTDARGRVRGLDNAFVADCSLIPVIPRANTNIPAVVIGERIANWLMTS